STIPTTSFESTKTSRRTKAPVGLGDAQFRRQLPGDHRGRGRGCGHRDPLLRDPRRWRPSESDAWRDPGAARAGAGGDRPRGWPSQWLGHRSSFPESRCLVSRRCDPARRARVAGVWGEIQGVEGGLRTETMGNLGHTGYSRLDGRSRGGRDRYPLALTTGTASCRGDNNMTESYTVSLESAPLAETVTPDALDAYASALFADRRIAGPAPSANLAINTVGLTTSIDAKSPDHAFMTTQESFLEAAKIAGLGKPMIVILDVELDRVDGVDRHE